MYFSCRLKIVLHSIIRYEVAVIKRNLDIYMNTQLPLLKICCNLTKEALVIIWYLFACFGKTLKITCMRFSVCFSLKLSLSTDRIFCLYQCHSKCIMYFKISLHSTITIWSLFRVMKTNLLQYLSSVYFANQPLHVSGIFVAHHQEVHCIYTKTGTCWVFLFYCLLAGLGWNGSIPTS
jgi:hypothetical protein